MKKNLIAYHGDPAVKEKYLARVRAHAAADEIVQGTYWQNGKGCAVGCTIHGSEHDRYETELGIPRIIARLEDGIFEGLPKADAKLWPEKFLSAIVTGSDLSMVFPKFMYWLLVDEKDGVIRYANTERTRKAIADVAELYRWQLGGEDVTDAAWRAAAAAAADAADDAAAWRAATAAWRAADDAAAAAAAAAADAAAWRAATAAADAAAWRAADDAWTESRYKARRRQAEKLLELLAEAGKVPA